MKHWVVMQAELGNDVFWAWGLVTDGPGFDDVHYTSRDGVTAREVTEQPRLTKHLFTVAVLLDAGDAEALSMPLLPPRALELQPDEGDGSAQV